MSAARGRRIEPLTGRAGLAARAHAAACAPQESCGVVVAGRYRPCENMAADPRNGFRIDPDALLEALQDGLEAIVHSHPYPHPPCPSERDMRQQLAHGVPCAIVPVGEDGRSGNLLWWGPGVPRPPLLGRPYRWGIDDCYSVGRDWYAEQGIDIPDFPRRWQFWGPAGGGPGDGDPNPFEAHFRDAGFLEVPAAEAAVGDALLMQIGTRGIAHCAVIVEPGVMLHHPCSSKPWDPGQLSRRDPVGRYLPYVRRVLRHEAWPP